MTPPASAWLFTRTSGHSEAVRARERIWTCAGSAQTFGLLRIIANRATRSSEPDLLRAVHLACGSSILADNGSPTSRPPVSQRDPEQPAVMFPDARHPSRGDELPNRKLLDALDGAVHTGPRGEGFDIDGGQA